MFFLNLLIYSFCSHSFNKICNLFFYSIFNVLDYEQVGHYTSLHTAVMRALSEREKVGSSTKGTSLKGHCAA
jgi:hypothetical protein